MLTIALVLSCVLGKSHSRRQQSSNQHFEDYLNSATGEDAVRNSLSPIEATQPRARASGVSRALATLLLQGAPSAAWQTPGHGGMPAAKQTRISSPRYANGLPKFADSRVASSPSLSTAVKGEWQQRSYKDPTKVPPADTFEDMDVKSKALLKNIKDLKFEKPMEMQNLAFRQIRDTNRDVGLVAEAGSGKTLAYLVPLIDQLMGHSKNDIHQEKTEHVVHVIVPTHDLAEQAMRVAKSLCAGTHLKLAFADAPKARSADLIIGTTGSQALFLTGSTDGKTNKKGRLAASYAHTRGRSLKLSLSSRKKKKEAILDTESEANATRAKTSAVSIERELYVTVVLDEADIQLAGAKAIRGKTGGASAAKVLEVLRPSTKKGGEADWEERLRPRVIAVSATMPGQGKATAGAWLGARFPFMKWIKSEGAHKPVAHLKSEYENVADNKARDKALISILEGREGRTLVFTNSVGKAKCAYSLLSKHVPKSALFLFHPEVKPHERDETLRRFTSRNNKPVLVCSGLGARGLDLPDIALVVEYHMATNIIEHVHRIGRTARAGKEGRSVSIYCESTSSDRDIVKEIQRCQQGGWKFL
mmetsp:Transcript_157027/g.277229  ORF Transcript_157027/g.277229 Transcript_157027/m.277229 type:complete len:589 (+) Transcript_157027:50-1816(+)